MECFVGFVKRDKFIGAGCESDDPDTPPSNEVTHMGVTVTHMGEPVTQGVE